MFSIFLTIALALTNYQYSRVEMVKIAYEYLVDTITTEMKQEYLDENVQWGNCGIPLAYGNLRAIF